MSPMMEQYLATKEEYSDCILFYRLGDFYEVFFDDAELVSKLCELVMTSKACGGGERAPMCGIPFHALDTYLAQLVGAGYKVAIAEQMEEPSNARKGLVPRDVIRVVTPGTVTSSAMLSDDENNYMMAVFVGDGSMGAAWCDLSTGEFNAREFDSASAKDGLLDVLAFVRPREIVTNADRDGIPWLWEHASLSDVLISTASKRLSFDDDAPSLLMAYLRDTQKQDINHLGRLHVDAGGNHMHLDHATLRNLELTETIFGNSPAGSLVGVLDKCKTAMGSRRLRQWMKEPLIDRALIESRLDAVEALAGDELARNNIRALMTGIYDLERLVSRVSLDRASIRDLVMLKQSLMYLPDIKAELESFSGDAYLARVDRKLAPLDDVCDLIERAISDSDDDADGVIKPGFSDELDEVRESVRDSVEWLANLEGSERERTGIKRLRTGRNKVFGYYIEVPRSQMGSVPDDYIRKQTTKTGERYVTAELERVENVVLGAQARISAIEKKLLDEVRSSVQARTHEIQQTALGLSVLDVICDFAEVSSANGYVKPKVTDGDAIDVVNGRHPVVERSMSGGFVANDVHMNKSDSSLLLITGPNMSGKSTYMRQLSLIVVMAQMGCFVPADSAEIGICDRIYTRIGSADNITMGQSTFYVEMSELANILNTATPKSLVVLDEIGRGTSTFDGLSIAWSTVEFLCDAGVRTMFATHYHELTGIPGAKGLRNLNVEVDEGDGAIEFTYRIAEGPASQSYGIQVAKLAGVPDSVLERAGEILASLEGE